MEQLALVSKTHIAIGNIKTNADFIDELTSVFLESFQFRCLPRTSHRTYKHERSSLSFQLYTTQIGNKCLLNTTVDDITSFTIDASPFNEFISALASAQRTRSLTLEEYTGLIQRTIKTTDITTLFQLLKRELVEKWVPGLGKEGYESLTSTATQTQDSSRRDMRDEPRGFQPEYPIYPAYPAYPQPHNPDLSPFPQHPDLRIPRINPLTPQGLFVGPDDPMFDVTTPRFGGLAASPGARFDPVMPFGTGRGGLGRGRGGMGRGGYGQFSGDPDNDELMPPGSRDMYL